MDEKFHSDRGIKPKISLASRTFTLFVLGMLLVAFFLLAGAGIILAWKFFFWALSL